MDKKDDNKKNSNIELEEETLDVLIQQKKLFLELEEQSRKKKELLLESVQKIKQGLTNETVSDDKKNDGTAFKEKSEKKIDELDKAIEKNKLVQNELYKVGEKLPQDIKTYKLYSDALMSNSIESFNKATKNLSEHKKELDTVNTIIALCDKIASEIRETLNTADVLLQEIDNWINKNLTIEDEQDEQVQDISEDALAKDMNIKEEGGAEQKKVTNEKLTTEISKSSDVDIQSKNDIGFDYDDVDSEDEGITAAYAQDMISEIEGGKEDGQKAEGKTEKDNNEDEDIVNQLNKSIRR